MPVPDPTLLLRLSRAMQAHQAGDLDAAEVGYRQVLEGFPDQPDAWCNLAEVLRLRRRGTEALTAARRAVDLTPEAPLALRGLGLALADQGLMTEALIPLERAAALAPREPVVLSALADLHHRLDDDEAALTWHRAARACRPDHPLLRLNEAYGLLRLGHFDAAEVLLKDLAEAVPRAAWLLAYTRLLQGRWCEAWPHFAARLALPEAVENRRALPQPRWDGTPFTGRRLLIWGEQGYGDALMALRLLPRVKALGGEVRVLTYAPLIPLLRHSLPADGWVDEGGELPPADLQAPLLDLPALLGVTPETASSLPLLRTPPDHRPTPGLAEALGPDTGRRRMAVVWAGNPRHQEDRRRSLDPAHLASLGELSGVDWFSLQVGATQRPPLPGIVDLAPHLRDFADTAWALDRLDAVVTVDTSVAHLAGALGRPTHLLLPFHPDWRWGFQGTRTPWYDSLRLYRQGRAGDWSAPLSELREALA